MANPKFEANIELDPVTVQDAKTGLFSSRLPIFKNISGIGRTEEEAKDNLLCSLNLMWKNEREKVVKIIADAYFSKEQKPNNVDLITA